MSKLVNTGAASGATGIDRVSVPEQGFFDSIASAINGKQPEPQFDKAESRGLFGSISDKLEQALSARTVEAATNESKTSTLVNTNTASGATGIDRVSVPEQGFFDSVKSAITGKQPEPQFDKAESGFLSGISDRLSQAFSPNEALAGTNDSQDAPAMSGTAKSIANAFSGLGSLSEVFVKVLNRPEAREQVGAQTVNINTASGATGIDSVSVPDKGFFGSVASAITGRQSQPQFDGSSSGPSQNFLDKMGPLGDVIKAMSNGATNRDTLESGHTNANKMDYNAPDRTR